MADQPGADQSGIVAHEDPEIGEGRIAQERLVILAEAVIDDLAVFPRWLILETEAKPGRQIHRELLSGNRAAAHAILDDTGSSAPCEEKWIATLSSRSSGASTPSR